MAAITHVSFISVPAADLARARDFYRDRLGLPVAVDEPMGESRWIMLDIPGARTRLHLDDRAGRIDPEGRPAAALIVPELDATVERLQSEGVEVMRPPQAAEWNADVRYALIRDSEDNILLLATG